MWCVELKCRCFLIYILLHRRWRSRMIDGYDEEKPLEFPSFVSAMQYQVFAKMERTISEIMCTKDQQNTTRSKQEEPQKQWFRSNEWMMCFLRGQKQSVANGSQSLETTTTSYLISHTILQTQWMLQAKRNDDWLTDWLVKGMIHSSGESLFASRSVGTIRFPVVLEAQRWLTDWMIDWLMEGRIFQSLGESLLVSRPVVAIWFPPEEQERQSSV